MSGDDDVKLDTELLNRMADRGLQCLHELDDFLSIQAEVFNLRGQLLRAADRFSEAIVWLQRSTDLDAENLDTYLGLGWCYKRLGRVDLAFVGNWVIAKVD